jgi:hypothetical protein
MSGGAVRVVIPVPATACGFDSHLGHSDARHFGSPSCGVMPVTASRRPGA